MSTALRRSWLALTLVTVLLGPLTALLSRDGALLVHRCVADGAAGRLGLRMALVRTEVDCPSGLAVGADGGHVIGLALMIAVPVLLAHLAAASLGVGIAALAGRALRSVARVLARRPRPGAVSLALPAARNLPVLASRAWTVVQEWAAGTFRRRGPPRVALV